MDIQGEIRRAMERIRVAHEILAKLTVSQDDSVKELLRGRAESLSTRLTETELEVMSRFIGGQSLESIAKERQLTERTISNQIRTGYQKLGFSDRRELKGWGTAISGFILSEQRKE